jgi:hypothetical protein
MPDDQIVLESDEQTEQAAIAADDVEGEEDLDKNISDLSQAVVAGADWTTETILSQLNKANIELNPKFQRRDAWRPSRKSKFIESLILGVPVPQLVLAENKRKRNSYIVIDGKQRLLTLRQFAAPASDPVYEQLKLEGLEFRTDLVGKSLEDLLADPKFEDSVRAFQNQTIRTVIIKGWPREDVLYLTFLRLNTGNVQLSPQELRQALHPGPFLDFVQERSGTLPGLQRIWNTNKPDFRMRDAELLVRYYAFKNFLDLYKGNLKAALDYTCGQLNADWNHRENEIDTQATELQRGLDFVFEVFGDHAFRKWDGTKYERRFNRAVYDIMVYYFSEPAIRKAARTKQGWIEKEFKSLCARDPDFRTSIETTTKSVLATVTRLKNWGAVLQRRLGVSVAVPKLKGKQIVI